MLNSSFEENITITCENIPSIPELEFMDNCSNNLIVTFEETTEGEESETYIIYRTWTVGDCAGNEAVFTQTITVLISEIKTTTVDLCTEDSTFDLFELLSGEFDDTGTWEDSNQTGALSGIRIDPSKFIPGNYTFGYVITGNCPSTTLVQVSINDDCIPLACSLDDIKSGISKVVTPGTDTFNDFFIVDKERVCGFTYDLKIFNRWGNEIFESRNYQNNWDGYSNKSFSGSQLPSGTYYYILEINGSGLPPIQGYIYLGTK